MPADCKNLIDKLKACNQEQFLQELKSIETWTYGEFYFQFFLTYKAKFASMSDSIQLF